MATIIFDGTSDKTATSTDTVIITANPANFRQAADTGTGGSTFQFSGATLTYTNLSVAAADNITTLSGGTFKTGPNLTNGVEQGVQSTSANDLLIDISFKAAVANPAAAAVATSVGSADSTGVHAVFGGLGVSGPADGDDFISIGTGAATSGSYLVYGNAGADSIVSKASSTFDSTAFTTIFGGKGNDTITFSSGSVTGSAKATNLFIAGGEDSDTLTVTNGGGAAANTIILGGQGPGDALDLADTINFAGGGTVTIYGNGGADAIRLGGVNGQFGLQADNAAGTTVDSTTNATIFGGIGNDTIGANFVAGAKGGNITIFGGQDLDTITVTGNAGRTVIYGGTGPGDAADGADVINFASNAFTNASNVTFSSNATIYANGGADTVNLTAGAGGTASATTVFAGSGSDVISVTGGTVNGAAVAVTGSNGTYLLNGNEGADTFAIGADSTFAFAGVTATNVGVTGTTITIADFASGDRIVISDNRANAQTTVGNRGDLSSSADLTAALNAATQETATAATVFRFGQDSYLVINDQTAGFSGSTDAAIKLTGVTDLSLLTATGAVTLV